MECVEAVDYQVGRGDQPKHPTSKTSKYLICEEFTGRPTLTFPGQKFIGVYPRIHVLSDIFQTRFLDYNRTVTILTIDIRKNTHSRTLTLVTCMGRVSRIPTAFLTKTYDL